MAVELPRLSTGKKAKQKNIIPKSEPAPAISDWYQSLLGTKAWGVAEKLAKRSGQEDCSSRRNSSGSVRPNIGTHVLFRSLSFIFLIVDKETCRITIKSL